jgi:hypothetical protein
MRKERAKGSDATAHQPGLNVAIATTPSSGLSVAKDTRLVRESILYADRIILYSPVATMLSAAAKLADADDMDLLELTKQALATPTYRRNGELDPLEVTDAMMAAVSRRRIQSHDNETIAGIETIQQLIHTRPRDPRIRMLVHQMRQQLEPIRGELERIVERLLEDAGASDLAAAIEAGILEVHPLGIDKDAVTAEMLDVWMDELTQLLTTSNYFPLLDPEATGLVRAMIAEGKISPSALSIRRGGEATTATSLVGYLPTFPALPIDELLDLRAVLSAPIARFRGAVSELVDSFAIRPFDEDFSREVEHSWLVSVEPALVEIREDLANAGFLRTSAAVMGRDVKALAMEAGGAIAFGVANWTDLSAWIAAAAALALPSAHLSAAALVESRSLRREAMTNKFFLLHHVGDLGD